MTFMTKTETFAKIFVKSFKNTVTALPDGFETVLYLSKTRQPTVPTLLLLHPVQLLLALQSTCAHSALQNLFIRYCTGTCRVVRIARLVIRDVLFWATTGEKLELRSDNTSGIKHLSILGNAPLSLLPASGEMSYLTIACFAFASPALACIRPSLWRGDRQAWDLAS